MPEMSPWIHRDDIRGPLVNRSSIRVKKDKKTRKNAEKMAEKPAKNRLNTEKQAFDSWQV